jgi:hypothetical protein
MILNLFAFSFFLIVAAIGLFVIRSALRRGRLHVLPACAQCGMLGESLTSFDCPRCGRDVREVGLIVPPGRSPKAVFWRVVGWSVAVVLMALVGVLTVAFLGPSRQKFVLVTSVWFPDAASVEREEIELLYTGEAITGGSTVTAQLDASVTSPERGASTFILQMPSQKVTWQIPDSDKPADMGNYSPAKLREWLVASGARLDGTERSRRALGDLEERFKLAVDRSNPFGSRAGWSGSGSAGWPGWVNPAMAMAWPAVWLAGLAIILRPVRPRAAAQPGATEGALA